MSDELYVDTDGLRNAAGSLSQLTTRVVNIANQLQGTLGSLGEPWGDDDTGQQFASKYLGPADQIMQGINSIGSVLDSTVQGLGTMANGYSATEEENRSSIKLASGSSQSGTDQLRSAERTAAPMMMRAEAVQAQPAEAVAGAPVQPGERLEAREEEAPLEPAEASDGTSVQPGQRLELREADTPLQPTERLAAEEPAIPAQPTERFAAEEPATPAQPALSDRLDASSPMEALTPGQANTPAHPAERLEATRATSTPMRSARPLAAREDDVPAQNGEPADLTPVQPREALTPAQPAERLEATRATSTPMQPAQTGTTRPARTAPRQDSVHETRPQKDSVHETRPRKDVTRSQGRPARRDEPADS